MLGLCVLFLLLTPASSAHCPALELGQRWYLARINFGGLCNTLFMVYGQVPLALLFNASLVVSEMYSRRSFADSWGTFVEKPVTLPFSSFYDLRHFADYWRDRNNLTVIEVNGLKTCLHNQKVYDMDYTGPMDFEHNSDRGVMKKAEGSGISLPFNSSVRLLRIAYSINPWCYYNFWQSNEHLKLLKAVHESLRPAKRLRELVDSFTRRFHQPNASYWAIHLRLEPDIIPESDANDSAFRSILAEQRHHILASRCYREAIQRNESLPAIYATSGIFQHTHHDDVLHRRAALATAQLREMGFAAIHHGRAHHDVYPEQQALVDLYIAKQARCFIPCYTHPPRSSSSYSYMVVRLRQVEAAKELRVEHFRDIEQEYDRSDIFYTWGM